MRMLTTFFERTKPGLDHGEAGLHEEHQEGRDHQPGLVKGACQVLNARGVVFSRLGVRRGDEREREGRSRQDGERPSESQNFL